MPIRKDPPTGLFFCYTIQVMKYILIALAAVLLLAGGAFYLYGVPMDVAQNPSPTVEAPPAGPIVIQGIMVCLPHRDTEGPQTLECAFGLQDDKGRYFALSDTDPTYKNISGVPMNLRVEIEGTFMPREDTKYQSIGIIEVTSAVIADVPKRASLEGMYVCLPYKDLKAPKSKECVPGLETADGVYYALDFALMSQTAPQLTVGDRISGSGVVVSIEQLSTDHWNVYPIKGIFSVTDSLQKL